MQAALVSTCFGGYLVSEDRAVVERHQMAVILLHQGLRGNTSFCYAPLKKLKSFPKALLQAQNIELQQRPAQGKSYSTLSATKANPGLCLPEPIFTDFPSLCTAPLPIMSFVCTSPLFLFLSLILEASLPISLQNFNFNAIFCNTSVPLQGYQQQQTQRNQSCESLWRRAEC